MEITRHLRKDKLTKNGFAPIHIAICWEGHRLRISSGQRCRPEHWDEEGSRVMAKPGSYYAQINPVLDLISSTAEQALHTATQQNRRLPEAELEQLLEVALHPPAAPAAEAPSTEEVTTEQEPAFWRLLKQWIAEYGKKVNETTFQPLSPKTIAGLQATRARLEQFAARDEQVPTLAGMNQDFYHAFRTYVVDELGQELNTFGKHIRRLKAFLTWCEEQDLPVNRRYRKFVAPTLYVGVDALTEQELRRLQRLDFTSPEVRARLLTLRGAPAKQGRQQLNFEDWAAQVALARDKLLVCVYTGLRISDAETLAWTHVHGQLIQFKAAKNQQVCYIPFYEDDLFHLPSLSERYEHRTGLHGQLLLPPCPRINTLLKVVQALAGITRLTLSSKLGRKTFVTLKLYQGVPTRLVMQATGHQTEESFNRYVGMDTLKFLQEYMRKSPGLRQHAA